MPDMTLPIVGLLVLLSAISSGSETAFLSVSKARLHQQARQGSRRAMTALNLVSHPDPMLTTILLVNTLVNIAASAMVTAYLVTRFGEVGVVYATVLMSTLILIFAEALPKTFGARFAEPITLLLAPTFLRLVKVCTPFAWVVKTINRMVLRLLGLAHHKHGQFTESDIRGAINLGLEHGALKRSEQRMLDAVLDLDDLNVADVMIHRSAVAALDINTPPEDIPAALGRLQHSRVPVFEGEPDNIIGFLYVRDYLTALAQVKHRKLVKLRQQVRPTYFVPETTPVGHQLLEFLKARRHLALVVDEYGDVQGMISVEDILEEIVGEFADENAPAEDEKGPDGSVLLAGRTPVRDANRRYNWRLPDANAVTLAGLMVEKMHHLPAQGESVVMGKLVLTVASKRGHRIERVHIAPLPVEPSPTKAKRKVK